VTVATIVGDPAPASPEPEFGGSAFTDLAEMVKTGHCILFLGAGVHYPPPEGSTYTYKEEQRPPLGSTLAKEMAPECDFKETCGEKESDENLQRVSLCYQRKHGRQKLVERVKAAVHGEKRPSAAVRGLAEMPFRFVMTTNYDRLFERALQRPEKEPVERVYEATGEVPTKDFPGDLTAVSESAPWLFKMHGDINDAASIVITDEDYINFVRRMTTMGDNFYPIPSSLHYLLRVRPVLFVGYGLLDFNLRLLFQTMRWRLDEANAPHSFSVDVRPDPLVKQVWSEKLGLSFIVEDVWSFVPRLYKEVLGREMPA
jgi:hypothetical protein